MLKIYISVPIEEDAKRWDAVSQQIMLHFALQGEKNRTYIPTEEFKSFLNRDEKMLRKLCDAMLEECDYIYFPCYSTAWQKTDMKRAQEKQIPVLCDKDLVPRLKNFQAKALEME